MMFLKYVMMKKKISEYVVSFVGKYRNNIFRL